MLTSLRHRVGRALSRHNRWRLARRYVSGHGLELGALHAPMRLPPAATVRYVDRLPVEKLREVYPELAGERFVPVDVVDDAETLLTVPPASQRFVAASHLLEHCEDPISAVHVWLRVLEPGGFLLLAVPDGRFTFDRRRPVTPLAHVERDRAEGPAVSRLAHYAEWVALVDGCPEAEVEARALALMEARHSIHFHVWDAPALAAFLRHCVATSPVPARLAAFVRNRAENLAVLGRPGATSPR